MSSLSCTEAHTQALWKDGDSVLELYRRSNPPKGYPVIADVEEPFMLMRITQVELARVLMAEIDQAKYVDETEFVDRFGRTLPMSKLSTGCKAVLVVAHNPTKVVDLIECGYNARDAIIRNIRTGKVLFVYNDISIDYPGFDDFEIDVFIDGERFTSLDDLNLYLSQGM